MAVSAEDLVQGPAALWSYRGEGGATLVMAHSPEKVVLRLRKGCRRSSQASGDFADDEQVSHNLDFCKNVFLPLMGAKYVQEGKIVNLPEGFAAKMNESCRALRPAHRLHMEIDENYPVGVLMPDFCLLPKFVSVDKTPKDKEIVTPEEQVKEPTFSVEIKPKCGFVPTSSWITQEHAVRRAVCHYCLLQKLKVQEGKYKRESRYCPVDLFSGVEGRVMYALECLVADPQNNWRVFKDGSIVYSEETCQEALKSKEICCYELLLDKSLACSFKLAESSKVTAAHSCGTIGPNTKAFLEVLLQILIADSCKSEGEVDSCRAGANIPQVCQGSKWKDAGHKALNVANAKFGVGGVLQRLLSIQRLDELDVEGVLPIYQQVKRHCDANPGFTKEIGVDGPFTTPLWKDIVSLHINEELIGFHCTDTKLNCLDASLDFSLNKEDQLNRVVQQICQFAIASTAKDCSIMITFQKSSPRNLPCIKDSLGVTYQYNISLVDLDPKEFDRVVKYHKDACHVVHNMHTLTIR